MGGREVIWNRTLPEIRKLFLLALEKLCVVREPGKRPCGKELPAASKGQNTLHLEVGKRGKPQSYNCKELNSVKNLNDVEVETPPHPLGRNAACQYIDFGPVRPAQDI